MEVRQRAADRGEDGEADVDVVAAVGPPVGLPVGEEVVRTDVVEQAQRGGGRGVRGADPGCDSGYPGRRLAGRRLAETGGAVSPTPRYRVLSLPLFSPVAAPPLS